MGTQNLSLLPSQYGTALDRELTGRDILYALSELFHFAAAAETQVLDLLEKRIFHELSFVDIQQAAQ